MIRVLLGNVNLLHNRQRTCTGLPQRKHTHRIYMRALYLSLSLFHILPPSFSSSGGGKVVSCLLQKVSGWKMVLRDKCFTYHWRVVGYFPLHSSFSRQSWVWEVFRVVFRDGIFGVLFRENDSGEHTCAITVLNNSLRRYFPLASILRKMCSSHASDRLLA